MARSLPGCRRAALHLFDAESGEALFHGMESRLTCRSDVIIGIDAGTSVIKAVAFDLDGAQLAVTALPNAYASLPDGGVEQDMARTWSDTAAVLQRLAGEVLGSRRAARRSR